MRERLKRWPLVAQPSNRSESPLTDARLVNAYAEKDPNTGEYVVQKRIGWTTFATLAGPSLGMYGWGGSSSFYQSGATYALVGNVAALNLYKNGVVLAGGAFGTSPGGNNPLAFWTETQPLTNRKLVGAVVGTLFHTDGTTVTNDTAALPGTRGTNIYGPVYLDGVIYFMDELGQIFGSAIDDPTTWPATNVIVARKIPGQGVALVKQLSYVIALKENSMEVFYDANNPSPGSALGQIDGATTDYGCAFAASPQVIDGILFYVTSNKTVSPQVVRVDNLASTIISTPAVDKMMDGWLFSPAFTYGFSFKHGGHRFYGVTSQNRNNTPVYDIDQGMWYQWTDVLGNFFPPIAMASDGKSHYLQYGNPSTLYTFEGAYTSTSATDNGSVATVDIYTPNMDFGTRRRKTLHRMYFNTDQTPGSILYVSRSDNDYKNFSRPRKVNLARETPYLDGEGTFTRRAYHFQHKAATDFRIRSSDLQMELGTV